MMESIDTNAQTHRTQTFRAMHDKGCWVMPNPWDIGSARLLEQMGFRALASTSSGFAWTLGRRDNHITLEQCLDWLRTLCASVDVPVNADFEGGFAIAPAEVAANVARAVQTGVSGLSIEDSTGNISDPLFDRTLAIERMKAARTAIDESGTGVVLTGRSEGFIVGRPDLDETIRRLTAYADAGADCLYAPGIKSPSDIAAVVKAVAPKPVNVLVSGSFTTVAELADLGVRRVSVGGALARVAWGAVFKAAQEIRELGTFSGFSSAATSAEIEGAVSHPRVPSS